MKHTKTNIKRLFEIMAKNTEDCADIMERDGYHTIARDFKAQANEMRIALRILTDKNEFKTYCDIFNLKDESTPGY